MEFLKCSFNGVTYGTGISDIARSQLLLAGKDATDKTKTMPPLPTASVCSLFGVDFYSLRMALPSKTQPCKGTSREERRENVSGKAC